MAEEKDKGKELTAEQELLGLIEEEDGKPGAEGAKASGNKTGTLPGVSPAQGMARRKGASASSLVRARKPSMLSPDVMTARIMHFREAFSAIAKGGNTNVLLDVANNGLVVVILARLRNRIADVLRINKLDALGELPVANVEAGNEAFA